MAKRTKHSFIKFQKELERKKKAKEKLDRKQGKKDQEINVDNPQFANRTMKYMSVKVLSQLSLDTYSEIADKPEIHDFHSCFGL